MSKWSTPTRRKLVTSGLRLGASIAAWGTVARASANEGEVRIALTAAAVRDELPLYDRWGAYLERYFGRPVRFVQRKTYRDVLELLRTGELDFAWVCSHSFTQAWDAGLVDLAATPVFRGRATYRSYVIVHRDDPTATIDGLSGRIFAFTDPDSATGYIIPRAMLRESGRDPDRFFRQTFFTWDHGQAIEAVAERVADGGSVDSYVWEYIAQKRPRLGALTRKIAQSAEFGFPPMVARRGIDPVLAERFSTALMRMPEHESGRKLLEEMMLDGFVQMPASHYEGVWAIGRSHAAGASETPRTPPAR